jgi:hypothetical protein
MRRFLASNSLAILSLIAIKNSQRESREGQTAVFTNRHFVPGPVVGSRRPWARPPFFNYQSQPATFLVQPPTSNHSETPANMEEIEDVLDDMGPLLYMESVLPESCGELEI